MEGLIAITIGLVGIAVLLFLGFKVFRLLVGYEIADDSIKVLLFHYIPIYKIPFTNIEKIYLQRFHEVVIVPGWHFPSRIFSRRVTIELKNSWF